MFFSFVIDAYSRRVVGWQFAGHTRTNLVTDALRMTLTRRQTGADVALVHHSDAGSQPSYAFAGHKPTGEQGTGSQIEDAFAIRHAFVVASSATEMEQ